MACDHVWAASGCISCGMTREEALNAAAAEIEKPAKTSKQFGGRPVGATNYGSLSHVAKALKAGGVAWSQEIASAYRAYREAYDLIPAGDRAKGLAPDGTLLSFWAALIPYLAVHMNDRLEAGLPLRKPSAPKISKPAIEALNRAEAKVRR